MVINSLWTIVNGRLGVTKPPAVATVTGATPGETIRPAGTVALSEAHGLPLAGTQVAASEVPLKTMDIPAAKFAPVAVSVKAGLPATAELGFRLRSVGGGACTVTVKFTGAEWLPPGFTTTTGIGPAFAIMAAVTGAVRVPELTKVVASGVPPNKT